MHAACRLFANEALRNACTQILQGQGVAALRIRLGQQAEAELPAFKKKQPKYSAFFSWMAKRIQERFPDLDEASRDELLCMDSGELDILLLPQNKHLDTADLLDAARNGIDWKAFQSVATSEAGAAGELALASFN
jgi:hypothetical protein